MRFEIQWMDRLPSTNTFLKELCALDSQLPAGTVVVAKEQTQGRGRRARVWLSGEGENLTFSFLLKGDFQPRKLPSVAMAAAIAVADLLHEEGIPASLKWPNDVLVNGRKICGILSESVSGGVVIGIGLNVNMRTVNHIDQPATSMWMETHERREVDHVLHQLLVYLAANLDHWKQGGFSKLRNQWESNVSNLGNRVTVRDGVCVRQGVLIGFGEDGELLLETEGGQIFPIWAGDLSF